MGRLWTTSEIDLLLNHYDRDGIAYCMQGLDRSRLSVTRKAYSLGLKTSKPKPKARRHIIRKIGKNKVIAACPSHGEFLHYYGYKGQSLQCAQCLKDSNKQWRQSDKGKATRRRYDLLRSKNPVVNYANRLRSRLNYYKTKQGDSVLRGCFRYLPFSPTELYDHLEGIRLEQGNKCPICRSDYRTAGYHVDHVEPLANALSMEEVWFLFNLSNLSLLCPQCNGVKADSSVKGVFIT